jgi:hypothetical protein
LDAPFTCSHSEAACTVTGVANGEVNASVRPIFENAEDNALERAAEEHSEWCILYDMGMDFEGDVTNLQG